MAISDAYQRFLEDILGRVRPVTTKRMFGGLGIYSDAIMFALADDEVLYFKVDDSNRADFESHGMEPFRPFGDGRVMPYYEVPAEVMEDVDLLRQWIDSAIAVSKKRRPKRKQ